MTCDQCQPLIIDALLGDLPSEQRHAVDAHLAECAVCQAEYDRLQRDFSLLAETVQAVAPPAGVRARLMASLPAKHRHVTTQESSATESAPATVAFGMSAVLDQPTTVKSSQERSGSWPRGMLWAATLTGIAVGGWLTFAMQDRAMRNQAEQAATDQREQAAEELASVMRSAGRLAGKEGLRKAAFSSDQRPDLAAMLIWDVPSRQLHLHATGFPQPPSGQEYRLWLINAKDEWTLVGPLTNSTASAAGAYQVLATVPAGASPTAAAVTLSDAAGKDRGQEITRTQFPVE